MRPAVCSAPFMGIVGYPLLLCRAQCQLLLLSNMYLKMPIIAEIFFLLVDAIV